MVSTDERDVIDISMTASKHVNIILSLLCAHAMTGCDTVTRCNTIGKKTVLNILKFGYSLSLLGNSEENIESVVSQATTFISSCYKKGSAEKTMTRTGINMWKQRFAKSSATAKFLSTNNGIIFPECSQGPFTKIYLEVTSTAPSIYTRAIIIWFQKERDDKIIRCDTANRRRSTCS